MFYEIGSLPRGGFLARRASRTSPPSLLAAASMRSPATRHAQGVNQAQRSRTMVISALSGGVCRLGLDLARGHDRTRARTSASHQILECHGA